MSIRKSRSKDVSNQYIVTGREYISLHCTLPSGQIVPLSIGLGTVDVNKREYISIDALFDNRATVEFSHDIPQNARLIVRMPAKHPE
jgi:hypothetical protein